MSGRHAGLLLPLFSMPSTRSWGVGEMADLPFATKWLAEAGQDRLLLLPLNEIAPGQNSPYSAITAMAIDPLFIAVPAIEDFDAIGGEAALPPDLREELARVRASPAIQYRSVRSIKTAALRMAFDRFFEREWSVGSERAAGLRGYVDQQAWWLDDYSLYRAIRAQPALGDAGWMDWPEELRERRPQALARARRELSREIIFYQYLQWIADTQWQAARAAVPGVWILGDFPFMVSADSADVWARQEEFRLDASVGTPPDAFSETGQNWGLPVYRWDVIARNGFEWLHQRARRCAALYDGFRIHHLVGFYRTFVRPADDSAPFFVPHRQPAQLTLGERLLRMFKESGASIIAEDLGVIPGFVRLSLRRLEVPGYRVMRWEREWGEPGKPFCDPADYPAVSVATSGTHDTDTLAEWWETADEDERAQILEIPAMRHLPPEVATAPYSPEIRDALLAALYGSGSNLIILPIQDAFGWRDRVNVPATVSDENWTYRLPWPIDRIGEQPDANERAAQLRQWAEQYERMVAVGQRT